MTKTLETQIEKSRNLIQGLRRHVSESGERGVTNAEIEQMERALNVLIQQSDEVERLRMELAPKVRQMNETMDSVRTAYSEVKKTLKGYYPQERWADYGIPDKR